MLLAAIFLTTTSSCRENGCGYIFWKKLFITPAAFYIGRASVIVDDDVTEVDGGFGGELIVSFNI